VTPEQKMRLIADDRYPRAAKYDPAWMYEYKMGCQCLWLAESLSRAMALGPGMRVLDLGCGKALSSIFLAKEFGATVYATDWWKWHIEKTGLFEIELGDDLDGDGARVTAQWAKIMDKYDGARDDGTMRWNRIVARRNNAKADDLRV